MATVKKVDIRGKSRHGGVSATIIYTDAHNNPVEEDQASFANVLEHDEKGNIVFQSVCLVNKAPTNQQTKSLPHKVKSNAPAPYPSVEATTPERKQPKKPPVPEGEEKPTKKKVPPSPFRKKPAFPEEEEAVQGQEERPVQPLPPEEIVKEAPSAPAQEEVEGGLPPSGQAVAQEAIETPAQESQQVKGPKLEDTVGALEEISQRGMTKDDSLSLAVSVADHSEQDLQQLARQLAQKVGEEGVRQAQQLAQAALQRGKQGPPTPTQAFRGDTIPVPGLPEPDPVQDRTDNTIHVITGVADSWDMGEPAKLVELLQKWKLDLSDMDLDHLEVTSEGLQDAATKGDLDAAKQWAEQLSETLFYMEDQYGSHDPGDDQAILDFYLELEAKINEFLSNPTQAQTGQPNQPKPTQPQQGSQPSIGQLLANNTQANTGGGEEDEVPQEERELEDNINNTVDAISGIADSWDMGPKEVNKVLEVIRTNGEYLDQPYIKQLEQMELDLQQAAENKDEVSAMSIVRALHHWLNTAMRLDDTTPADRHTVFKFIEELGNRVFELIND